MHQCVSHYHVLLGSRRHMHEDTRLCTPMSYLLLVKPLHDLAGESTSLRATYTELFVMHQLHLHLWTCRKGTCHDWPRAMSA